jgi:hypothetical protein
MDQMQTARKRKNMPKLVLLRQMRNRIGLLLMPRMTMLWLSFQQLKALTGLPFLIGKLAV